MLKDLRVSVIQMTSGQMLLPNLERAEVLIRQAADSGSQLIALPEYFPSLHADGDYKLKIAEDFGQGVIQDRMSELARECNVWIVAGSVPMTSKLVGKVTNTTLVFSPEGDCVVRYDKIHLFDFSGPDESWKESDQHEAGLQPICFDTPWGRIGLGICYDLRFPELFRALDNPDILIVPSAFTVPTGEAHWELLLRARAVENQCYLLAPAQGGEHENGRSTWGHSMIVDPWGEVLAEQKSGEGVVSADLTLQRFAEVRQQLPAWLHRKI